MYRLQCIMADRVEFCEDYESVDEAVSQTVAMWLEGEGDHRTMVLNDDNGDLVVTFIPTVHGYDKDVCLVVWATESKQQEYKGLRYVNNTDGTISRTEGWMLDLVTMVEDRVTFSH